MYYLMGTTAKKVPCLVIAAYWTKDGQNGSWFAFMFFDDFCNFKCLSLTIYEEDITPSDTFFNYI